MNQHPFTLWAAIHGGVIYDNTYHGTQNDVAVDAWCKWAEAKYAATQLINSVGFTIIKVTLAR